MKDLLYPECEPESITLTTGPLCRDYCMLTGLLSHDLLTTGPLSHDLLTTGPLCRDYCMLTGLLSHDLLTTEPLCCYYCMLTGPLSHDLLTTGPLSHDLFTTGPLCHDLLHAYWAAVPRYIPSIYRATVPAIFPVLQLFPFPRVLWDGLSFQSSLTNEQ